MNPIPSIQQAVWKAADQLMAQGVRPTVANVREVTRRGSAGTINDALKDWWQDLAERLSNRIPQPDVPEPVIDMTRQLWEMSLKHGEEAFKTLRVESLEQARKAEDERQLAVQALEQQRHRLEDLQARTEHLQTAEKELLSGLAAEQARRQEAESQLQQAVAARNEQEVLRTQVEKELALLAAQYQSAEQQWQTEREALNQRHERESTLMTNRLQNTEQLLQSQEAQLLQTEMKLLEAQTEIRLLLQRLDGLQQENAVLRQQAHAPQNRRETLKARLRRT
ncbi:plasmid replication DNA-binding protein KfrA [Fluviicoccus keumensis]|uniref:Plasmid replication DNA-binding protein KfrA n=1 Tax=Fluviicoccus keumensis TaxID=1435465 RepID=A0A4Q7Z6B7_9GAMM|nr:DNA-binding protein [Fluviicoccus keumensis]RZU45283.1 plasmid replication DNA-binding protein KfrA [Fluviicoccus keumensis]